jgi:mannose-6-phosphate isomerase-like protein (cupin superfamily)
MSESLGRDRLEQRAGPFSFTETWHAPALVLPVHEHEHACLHFVIDGRYQETVAGREQSLDPGAVLYKPAASRTRTASPHAERARCASSSGRSSRRRSARARAVRFEPSIPRSSASRDACTRS